MHKCMKNIFSINCGNRIYLLSLETKSCCRIVRYMKKEINWKSLVLTTFFGFIGNVLVQEYQIFRKVEEQDKHLSPIITKPHGSETEVVIDTIPLGKEDQESSVEIIMSVKLKGQ